MMSSRVGLGMVMGIGLLAAACGPALEDEIEVDTPGLEEMSTKPGGQDTNGTPKIAWHDWKAETVYAMQRPLLQGDKIHEEILATGILGDPLGMEVFDHAARCALSVGTEVRHGSVVFKGRGMVSGASLWKGQALPPDVIDNVLECVVAFVNDMTEGVRVLLTGLNVNDDGGDHSAFVYSEALWCADGGSLGWVDVEVYPTQSFVHRCGTDPWAALQERYCYQVGSCGLTYMGVLEFSANCTEVGTPGNGQYECNGKACTMTWLSERTPEWCERPTTTPSP